jgi:uncharacterized protein YqjF (DUF2071 family)
MKRDHPAFARIDHRPWPIPAGPWTWRQNWHDLLFAHWPVPVADLRRLVPDGLTIQEYDGTSWLGVVPFRMTGVMRWPFPDLPWVSAFPELNVRLYVERDGKPGVWFLSLDAANPLAVWAARRFFHLPYWYARMTLTLHDGEYRFRSRRRGGSKAAPFAAAYKPTSPPYEAKRGTLEAFLVERYCLYCQAPDGALYRAEVHHLPWPLQRAAGKVEPDELLRTHGLTVEGAPLLHFSRGVDVVVWPLERLAPASTP